MLSILFPSLYLFTIYFNASGLDDKNILLFLTTPPSWILEQFSLGLPIQVFYILGLAFWFLFGWLIDNLRRKIWK